MNSTFKYKLIQALNKKNGNKGFTLIELLVVVIIIGVLAAIALPNLLGQVAKGRQAEARNNLGTVNRAQQAYRLENATFALVSNLPVTTTSTYYSTVAGGQESKFGAIHTVGANGTFENDIRDYDSAVGQTAGGAYTAVICEQTSNPSVATVAMATTTATGATSCNTSGRLIQ
jgi:prepilin-type N-terminal cleavage/methylation domain-containing protein